MKKHLLLLFVALLPLVASAQTKVEIGGIWYKLTAETREAEVTFKGDDPFQSMWYSGSITIPATVTYDGVAYSVTSIGNYAFYGCTSLTATTIPEGVTSIGEDAFWSCSSLTAITIPEGVTSIGNSAFEGCRSLTSITLPEGVTSIGGWAFQSCTSLTAITIPEGVTSIGWGTFSGCTRLTSIVVAKGNKVYDSRGDCNAIIETNSNTLIQGCATTIIPEGVTSIGNYAFYGCTSLTAITIPEGVTSIGGIAFYKCSNLTAITLPEGVTSIEVGAFFWCSSLTAITLPASVTSIGGSAFNGCESLTDVYCNAEEIPHTSTNAFSGSNIENATLHVPASAMDEYKTTAPWSSFGTIKDIEKGDADGILTIPAKPVLIQCQGGVITLSGLDEGTEVAVFTANGTAVATATATDGTATLTTDLTAGTIAIVKTGDYSIKVAIK